MSTDPHANFLAAIALRPADNLPRLAYADWLEEHGNPDRARFIRLQIADTHAAQAEAAGLIRRYSHQWIADSFGHPLLPEDVVPGSVVWSRGFITRGFAPLDYIREHLPDYIRRMPLEYVGPHIEATELAAGGVAWFSDGRATHRRRDGFAWVPWQTALHLKSGRRVDRPDLDGHTISSRVYSDHGPAGDDLSQALLAEAATRNRGRAE